MNRKFLAREIIVVFSIILLAIIFFAGQMLKNSYYENQIYNLQNKSFSIYQLSDSLKIKSTQLLGGNYVYTFLSTQKLTSKNEIDFLKTYKNRDSAKIIYDFFVLNNLTTLNEDSFYSKYLSVNEINQYLHFQSIISKNTFNAEKIRNKINDYKSKIKNTEKIESNTLCFLYILIGILYLIRPSYIILKWSFKVLKE